MAQAGYKCVVRKSGITTTISAEPMSILSSRDGGQLPSPNSTVFKITDSTRRCVDPNQPWNVKVAGATVLFSHIVDADLLNGEFTMSSATAGAFTFNGNFLPITTSSDFVPETKSFSLTNSADLLDTTVMASAACGQFMRMRKMGLKDASLSVESIADDAKMAYLATVYFNGNPVVVEIYFGDDSIPRFRGLCLIDSLGEQAAVEGLVMTNLSFKVAAQNAVGAPHLNTSWHFKAQP